ncbi:MAG TPA: outer membrane protein assembly factor BamA [Acetobacteraceae bacterium]|nr:outer membrane protein assembly factor BamA [Acetobacteraceae bacterium]
MASACLLPVVLPAPASMAATHPHAAHARAAAPGTRIAAIDVTGNQRIDTSTILSYMVAQPGSPFNAHDINLSLKTLYATGLFKTVSITRQGDDLLVRVVENPIVNAVYFQGNKAVSDKEMKAAISLKPNAVFTPAEAAAARKQILALYAKHSHYDATVTPEIVRLPENRVNVVFDCHDGPQTLISRINFIGNRHYGQGRLREVISTRQSAWFRFLSSADEYNPERVKYDEELLRKFYYHHGYADFKIDSATAQLAPDRKSFYLTFVLNEGPRYHISHVAVVSSIRHLSGKSLRPLVPISKGEIFDGDAIGAAVKAISTRVQNEGFAFAQVEPDVKEDHKNHTVALTFRVIEGPRVYVQRISITGNTRTEDSVIRRQIGLAEGDPFNETAVTDSKQNLKNLGYFKNPTIKVVPGSAPDKVILDTHVDEQATGSFSLGGGYSTDLGALLNIGLSQNNFLGTGIDTSISGLLAQRGTQFNLGVTNPYLFGRNLIGGFDLFRTDTYNTTTYVFSERSIGGDIRVGFRYNEHVRQAFTYTISQRDIYNIVSGASLYITNEQGQSSLSQIGQTLTFDYLNDRLDPSSGTYLALTTNFAGLGGTAKYLQFTANGRYYIPLEHLLGDKQWVLELDAGGGYLYDLFGYHSLIADRFFLGGDTLLGFQTGGVGPHDEIYGDSLGGNFMWTQDTVLHFPLPVSPDLGVSGFAFTDVGSLSGGVTPIYQNGTLVPIYDNPAPRVSVGVGVAWNTPFGLINLSFAEPIVKHKYDQVEQFRVSFGTRF